MYIKYIKNALSVSCDLISVHSCFNHILAVHIILDDGRTASFNYSCVQKYKLLTKLLIRWRPQIMFVFLFPCIPLKELNRLTSFQYDLPRLPRGNLSNCGTKYPGFKLQGKQGCFVYFWLFFCCVLFV